MTFTEVTVGVKAMVAGLKLYRGAAGTTVTPLGGATSVLRVNWMGWLTEVEKVPERLLWMSIVWKYTPVEPVLRVYKLASGPPKV